MARTCAVVLAVCVAAILVLPTSADARPRALNVALPSPGDLTLMHVEFKRSVARSRRLPRYQGLSAATRRTLRRARVTVVGSATRMSSTRVIGTLVLLRREGGSSSATAQAARSLRVMVNRPVASVLMQRNVLRRRPPRGTGAEAAQGDILCGDNWWSEFIDDLDSEQTNRVLLVMGYEPKGFQIEAEVAYTREAPALAYGLLCDVYPAESTGLLDDIGAQFPFSCRFSSTYIGAATDSEGNVITEPSFIFGGSCDKPLEKLHLTLHDVFVKMCRDSSGRTCEVSMDRETALFPYSIPAGTDWSVSVGSDPPLGRGERIEIVIDLVDGGQIRDEQVM